MERMEGERFKLWIDEHGIVHAHFKHDTEDLAGAKKGVEEIKQISGGVRHPVLVDIRRIKKISLDARRYYASEDSIGAHLAVALLAGSTMSRMIGNFFLGVNRPKFPVKLFDDESKAIEWLKKVKDQEA